MDGQVDRLVQEWMQLRDCLKQLSVDYVEQVGRGSLDTARETADLMAFVSEQVAKASAQLAPIIARKARGRR